MPTSYPPQSLPRYLLTFRPGENEQLPRWEVSNGENGQILFYTTKFHDIEDQFARRWANTVIEEDGAGFTVEAWNRYGELSWAPDLYHTTFKVTLTTAAGSFDLDVDTEAERASLSGKLNFPNEPNAFVIVHKDETIERRLYIRHVVTCDIATVRTLVPALFPPE